MKQYMQNKLPTTWQSAISTKKQITTFSLISSKQEISSDVETMWKTRAEWVNKNKDIIHDFRSTYYGQNIEDMPCSDMENQVDYSDDDEIC